MTRSRLDRAGRALVAFGAIVLGLLAVLLVVGAAWFISYFGDGSGERGLAAMLDVWPVWLFAVVVIALVAVTLAWVVRGGRVALVTGGIGGLMIGVVGITMLVTGQHDELRWLLLLIGATGGLTLASGAAGRLAARSSSTE